MKVFLDRLLGEGRTNANSQPEADNVLPETHAQLEQFRAHLERLEDCVERLQTRVEPLDGIQADVNQLSMREQEVRAMLLGSANHLFGDSYEPAVLRRSIETTLGSISSVGLVAPVSRNTLQEHILYRQAICRIRGIVKTILPASATIIVVSRGDEDLVDLNGRTAWHFPQSESGVYAGNYPASSEDAIRHLETLRTKGGDYLLFPCTSFWWLEHYADFADYLDQHSSIVVHQPDTCAIYRLEGLDLQSPGSSRHSVNARAESSAQPHPEQLEGR